MEIENIKFKAKRIDNGEWVEGYFYKERGNTYIIEDRQSECPLNRNLPHLVDSATVCQFTGLKDKDGKEVWEHDILIIPGFTIGFEGEAVFSKGGYCLKRNGGTEYTFSILDMRYFCVIGNKFDGKKNEEEK